MTPRRWSGIYPGTWFILSDTPRFLEEIPLRTQSGIEARAAELAAETATTPTTAAVEAVPRTAASVGPAAGPLFTSDGASPGTDGTISAAWWRRRRDGQPEPASAADEPAPAPSVAEPAVTPAAVAMEDSDEPSRPWIFGRVTEHGDSPLAGAALTLTDLSGRQLDRDLSGSGGYYRLCPPSGGSYLVICASEAHQPTAALVAVAQVPVRHDVVLSGGGASVSGNVSTAETGAPLEGAVVTLVDLRGDVVGAVTTDEQGRFSFVDLAAGHYTVTVATVALQPVAQGVEVPRGGHVTQDVVVAARVQLVGVVRTATEGLPVAEALATLVSAADGQVVGSVITDAEGGFVFDDLDVGVYTVTAAGYPPVATEVSLGPGGPTETVITLRPPALPDAAARNGAARSSTEGAGG